LTNHCCTPCKAQAIASPISTRRRQHDRRMLHQA
jgi:hypothetical protein